jgi:diguanylate cyclase
MENQWSAEKINGNFRLALPLMSKQGIPITPDNYSVWYKYVSGLDSELCKRIDTLLKSGATFSPKTNNELYRQFCTEKGEAELGKIRQDLHLALTTLHQQLVELSGHAEEYESFVSDSVNLLSESSSLEDITNVVREIISKTKTLGEFGKTLKHKVNETTEALEVLKKDLEQIKTEASLDFLTGVPNRKAFNDALAKTVGETSGDGREVSLLLIDIDHFKNFNDTYGHLTGDEVLKFVAKKIKEIVRGRDFVARFGGEEFAVLLPHTSLTGAESVAENVRSFFAQALLKANASSRDLGTLTVSIGVARYRPGESSEQFFNRCDQALYAAKKTGRNRAVSERDSVIYSRFSPSL